MPALTSASAGLLQSLANRAGAENASGAATASNETAAALQVICAWPVSGQYGPGTRILYYTLVAACVVARKAEWLRDACLAAALLFPVVAALHGIVLAAVHVDGAVDMDIYGAFQLSSIAILAAPVTVRLSSTYFHGPGRNIIFVWTGLMLAGMLSLTVEFYRSNLSPCAQTDPENPNPTDVSKFPYGASPLCGLVCSQDKGPFSPMRKGSTGEIYVLPAPTLLDFGTATLFAAACCIPAILSLVSIVHKIRQLNWKSRFGSKEDDESRADELIPGTNGATNKKMKIVNEGVRFLLTFVEIPLFAGAILAILVIGERNFWSVQVYYGTEPIQSVGQWAPILTACLAALGSLYLFWEKDVLELQKELKRQPGESAATQPAASSSDSQGHPVPLEGRTGTSLETHRVGGSNSNSHPEVHDASRHKMAKVLYQLGEALGTPTPETYDDSHFQLGEAANFPETPGEDYKNRNLRRTRASYNPPRDPDGRAVRSRSRASSFVSVFEDDDGPSAASPSSPRTATNPSLSAFPAPPRSRRVTSPSATQKPQLSLSRTTVGRVTTFPVGTPRPENGPLSPSTPVRGRSRTRSNTLEVPSPIHDGLSSVRARYRYGSPSPRIVLYPESRPYTPESTAHDPPASPRDHQSSFDRGS